MTWVREHRRTNDAYRAPQRVAIGDIVAAVYELTLRVHAFRDLFEELARESREISGAELNEVSDQTNRAMLGVGRAFHVGRLTIVDAECFEAMREAFNTFSKLRTELQGVGEPASELHKLWCAVLGLNLYPGNMVVETHGSDLQ